MSLPFALLKLKKPLFLILLLSVLIRPAGISAQSPVYGMHADLPLVLAIQQGITLSEQIDLIKQTGTQMIRIRLSWDEIEKTHGQYTWGPTDDLLSRLKQSGLQPLAIIRDTPVWAKADLNCGGILTPDKICPPDIALWKSFITQIVERYGFQTGGLAYIRYWEIWNEPNGSLMFTGTVDDYFNLLKEAAPIIHAVDPGSKVLIGGITHRGIINASGSSWIDQLLQKPGIINAFDIFNFHLYGVVDNPENTFVKAKSLLGLYGLSSKPIWVTETNPGESSEAMLAAGMADWHRRIFNQSAEAVFYFTLPNWCQQDTTSDPQGCDQNVYTTERRTGGLVTAADLRSHTLAYAAYQAMVIPAVSPTPTSSPSPTPSPPSKAGDANGDNQVNGADYLIWLAHYGQMAIGTQNGDFNNDGRVNGQDYLIWLANYGR
ncbi:MAG: hypothetical protein UX87_C0011G0019 [Candidatus Amesbacteria bacterium GW2011_GWA1_47_16]|uniref:Glycoside hydrolase family 5 domain-containing protein n=1 Tax=Candidatus Amesbacteria bacterium GW2011_GWA1_47_16 TaxID=1618353 RepID=A0A0G1S479_9BACT|nr:MAG: hypothetical protein UX87_C0011G0019 [Candidatus Amesbacteria bacterium GW2011_GWA1_47_16]